MKILITISVPMTGTWTLSTDDDGQMTLTLTVDDDNDYVTVAPVVDLINHTISGEAVYHSYHLDICITYTPGTLEALGVDESTLTNSGTDADVD